MSSILTDATTGPATFRHEALFYAGQDGFLQATTEFIREGVRAGEPTLVVLNQAKVDLLRSTLGSEATGVQFADMEEVGKNPARIIPAWRQFVRAHDGDGKRLRGIGEPIWAGRSADELVECERHESLLNLAFDDSPAWWLLCPYDVDGLPPAVLGEAQRNHPFVMENGGHRASALWAGLDPATKPFDRPLPEPEGRPTELPYAAGALPRVRALVAEEADAFELGADRTEDLVLAVNELATNTLRHAGGRGLLRVWREPHDLICEVRDDGRIEDPLVGREPPATQIHGGFGMWLVTNLCDLVQVRTFSRGSVVRLHMFRS